MKKHPHPLLGRRAAATPAANARPPKITYVKNTITVIRKHKDVYDKVAVIIVNYKTPKLLKQCVHTLLGYYPGVSLILSDNNSRDGSVKYMRSMASRHDNIMAVSQRRNIGHGLAMNSAIATVNEKFFFTMDTDTIVIQGGFLEAMVKELTADAKLYALGWRRWVDRRSGVPIEWHTNNPNKSKFVAYIHPYAGMYKRSIYGELSKFAHHGAPCLYNMLDAERKGFRVKSFPIKNYVKHLVAGTRRMWGGQWDIGDKPPKREWNEKDSFPI